MAVLCVITVCLTSFGCLRKSYDKGRTNNQVCHLSLLLLVDLVYDMIWDCFAGQMRCGSVFCWVVKVYLVLSSVHFGVSFLHFHDSLVLFFLLGVCESYNSLIVENPICAYN